MKVLIADDDRIGLEMLARQLTGLGYEVVAADDGQHAWESFQRGGFSIVITDWLMPGMDGIELLSRIRSVASSQYVYCILLTAKGQLSDLIQGMEAGADDFLTKPFDPHELRVRLTAGRRIIELERKLNGHIARMRNDLQNAARIQRSLLPAGLLDFPNIRFASTYRPCDELGGDILNVVPLDDERVALYLLDVSGHGISAALLSVALSRLLTTATNASSVIRDKLDAPGEYRIVPPAEVLSRLNDRFCQDLEEGRFFTMLYGVLHLCTGQLRYASGGHNPALLLGCDGSVRQLESTGPLIGVVDNAVYEQATVQLRPRDRLFVYSDGIIEACDAKGVQFGLERLIELTKRHATAPIQTVLDRLVAQVEEWSVPHGLDDDVSCLFAEAVE